MDKEYNEYLWSPKQPRVYDISPLRISGTPMSEEDAAMSLRAENLQQSLQQNPIFKSTKQWAEQQKQREKEIAASKKWLELHPEDDNDDPYTIFERGKHQAIVDGKDPSYYEKMMNDGKQFTKGALTVLSLPYLSAAAAGAYGYGASLGARGLFAAQGIHGLANENGVKKTANLVKSGNYGRAALSGAGDALNAAMILPGAKLLGNAAKFLGSTAKYGLKSTVAGNMLSKNVRYNAPNMETVADYTNKQIFDNLMKYPNKEYNDIPVYLDLNTMKIKKVKNPELVKFEFWPDKFGEPVQLKKATDEFGNEVFLNSFDRNQGGYVDNTPLNRDQKFIHYRASEGYDGKTLFPKADKKVDPVGHIWFNANSSAHSFPDKYKLEHFAIDPIPSTGHSWSKSFRLVSDPVDVSNAIHTKYNPITLGLETQIKPFTPLKNTSIDKTSYAFFERPSKLPEVEPTYYTYVSGNQSINTLNPNDISGAKLAFESRYPESGVIWRTPIKDQYFGDPITIIGEAPMSQDAKNIAQIMKTRFNRFNIPERDTDYTLFADVQPVRNGPSGAVDKAINTPTKVFIPESAGSNYGGMYQQGIGGFIRLDPGRSKPYKFTQIHEGLSHPTDYNVKWMTPKSSPNKTVESLYEGVSFPKDLFPEEELVQLLGKDSRKWKEGRAVTWEIINDLNNKLAKQSGISSWAQAHAPEQKLWDFIDNTLKTPDDFIKYVKKFDNAYLNDYAKVLEYYKGTPNVEKYFNRIKSALKYLPAVGIPIGMQYISENNQNNIASNTMKQGGILKRK